MKKNCHILLVDDDEASNFLTSTLLEEMRVTDTISMATTGKQAIELIEEQCGEPFESNHPPSCPDLILLDLRMPVMDGFEFLDKFQLLPISKKVKVFVLSSSSAARDQERVQQYPVSGYLEKPFTSHKMLQALQQVC